MDISYLASEARPTLGSSIQILCGMCVGLSTRYVCQNVWAELRGPNTCMLKVSFLKKGRGKDRARRRTKNLHEENKRSTETEDYEKQIRALVT